MDMNETAGEFVNVPEVVGGNALERIERANIDIQISTAHAYPRSMEVFKRRATEMATLDEETAASCIYKRPVGRDDGGSGQKIVEGESVRLAEIVAACYGNIRAASMVVEMTDRYVKARGMAHDLETNNAVSSEVVESCVKKNGQPYSERQRAVIAKVALSKARRDAIFQIVPKALCKPIREAARKVAIGNAATLGERRDRAMEWARGLNIDIARVYAVLNVKGESDIGLDQLETLTGLRTAIRDGDTSVDEAFPRGEIQAPTAAEPIKAPTADPGNPSAPTIQELREEAERLEKAAPKGPLGRVRKALEITGTPLSAIEDADQLKSFIALLRAEGVR